VGKGFTPAVAPVNKMTPLPALSMSGTTCCAHKNAANVETRHVFSNVLGLVSISRPNGRIAALNSSTSTLPSSLRTRANARSISSAEATFAATGSARPPAASISRASFASFSSVRAISATA
jgi:hypothetical protein